MSPAQPALPLVPRRGPPRPAPGGRACRPTGTGRELWCALVLPELMLEVRPFRPGVRGAVFDPSRRVILGVTPAARTAGVRPGQSTTTAWAMCPNLATFARDPCAERRALERLAGWAAQFSPRLVLEDEGVVLEIGASLRLFRGLPALLDRISAGFGDFGYRKAIGIAPTPLAALWRARAGRETPVIAPGRVAGALASLSLDVMRLDSGLRHALEVLGVRRIADLMRLPRAGLVRRYGPMLLDRLDRALGRSPDPRPAWRPGPAFAGSVDLPFESELLSLLELALRRLTAELAGFARAGDISVRRFWLVLETGRGAVEVTLDCHVPLRDAARILSLAMTRLETIEMPAPVRQISLWAEDFAEHVPERELIATDASRGEALALLLGRIAARVGNEAVVHLGLFPDHRPERATWPAVPDRRVVDGPVRVDWPLLLLARPRRLTEIGGQPGALGRLEKLAGPERIESGWWDGAGVARDYYRMRARSGAELWVFHDRARGGWYLHGYFL